MSPLFDPELGRRISDCGIIAVLILDRVEDAVQVARSLAAGGVNAIELTFRTPAALAALKEIRAEIPEMIAGAGTILTADQVHLAKEAGAHFGVAPGMNPRVLAAARAKRASPLHPASPRPAISKPPWSLTVGCLSFSPPSPLADFRIQLYRDALPSLRNQVCPSRWP